MQSTTVQPAGAATRVVVVDDPRTFAELLADALDREDDLTCVGLGGSGDEAVALVERLRPDLVLMDVQMPSGDGITATRRIVEAGHRARVVVLTAHTDVAFVQQAADAGAAAFVPKDGALDTMLDTLRAVRDGAVDFLVPRSLLDGAAEPEWGLPGVAVADRPVLDILTPRETDVLQLMGEGLDVRTIARELGITEQTCRGYVKSLLSKLGAHSQLQAVVTAWRLGLLRPDGLG